MGTLFDAVTEYLDEDEWNYHAIPETTTLKLDWRGRAGSWQCFASVDEERQWFTFFSILPAVVPEDKRPEIAEFITRANYGLVIGNFEMDYNDGEVRYKTSIDVEGGELTSKMIETLIRANVWMMDRYFPGFMGVLFGDDAPAEAIAEIEDHEHEHGEDDEDEDEDEEFGYEEDDDDDEDEGEEERPS